MTSERKSHKVLIISPHFYPEDFKCNEVAFELAKRGYDVTALSDIPNYPAEEMVEQELENLPNAVSLPIESMAAEINMPKSANVILLGMAAKYIEILTKKKKE